ncbi:MAG TPA: hypothetical protein VEC19_01040 [Usitatibacter sp.]|nr:hypothetical protein [Usitatibacter sp.]
MASSSTAGNGNSASKDKSTKKAACKGLTPNDAAWQQNKCGNEMSDKNKAGNMRGGTGASAGEGSGSSAGGSSGAAGSGSAGSGSSGSGK